MLNAMSQGRSGSMCTIHADSSAGVFRRIASYAVQAPERLPLEASNLLIAGAVHLVVHLDSETCDEAPGRNPARVARPDGGPHGHASVRRGGRQLDGDVLSRRGWHGGDSCRRSGRWWMPKGSRSSPTRSSDPARTGGPCRRPRSGRRRWRSCAASATAPTASDALRDHGVSIARRGLSGLVLGIGVRRPRCGRGGVCVVPLRPIARRPDRRRGAGTDPVAPSRQGAGPRTASACRTFRSWWSAVVGGVLAVLVTGWPVAVPIAAVAIYRAAQAVRSDVELRSPSPGSKPSPPGRRCSRATLAASAGLGQAIVATAPLVPLPIRPATTRLAARLGAGMAPS